MTSRSIEGCVTHAVVHEDRLVPNDCRNAERPAIAMKSRRELGRVFADQVAVSLMKPLGDMSRLPVSCVQFMYRPKTQSVVATTAQDIAKEVKK